MKPRIAALTILCLALAAIPASPQVYENGPVNGTVDAWTINFGYSVIDTLSSTYAAKISGFDFYTWVFPGDKPLTVDWSILSSEMGRTHYYGGGTAKVVDSFIFSNQFGYEIHEDSVFGLDVALPGAGIYWLNLQNATTAQGDPLFWDQNSGAGCDSIGCPSQAFENSFGTIPLEAYAVYTVCGAGNDNTADRGPPAPEPSSIMLFGSGIVGLAGVLRRKLF